MSLFSDYFTKYRLRSGIKSLYELADLLAEKDFIVETSSLSRWQNGKRLPSNREFLILLIEIFVENNGIETISEANQFLASTGKGFLTNTEIDKLKFNLSGPQILPPRFKNFIGREKEIQNIFLKLSENNIVVLKGIGGIGKSTLAIEYAYRFKSEYPDGILWAKVDTSDQMTILATFLHLYNENVIQFRDVWSRSQILRSILSNKKVLIILDNVSRNSQIKNLLPSSHKHHLIITSRESSFSSLGDHSLIDLKSFNENDVLSLFSKKLGIEYTLKNKKEILLLSRKIEGLPLALEILAERFKCTKNVKFSKVIKIVMSDLLSNIKNKDNDIRSIFESSFISLSSKQKEIFLATGAIDGTSFSYQEIAYVSKNNETETIENLERLCELSLLQKVSSENRYKLHPLIHDFIKNQYADDHFYTELGNYFLYKYKAFKKRESVVDNSIFEQDVENIYALISNLKKIKKFEMAIELWEYFVLTLWDLGFWDLIIKLSSQLIDISRTNGDKDVEARILIRDLGILYFQRNQLDDARKVISKGLILANENKNYFLIAYAKLRFGMISLQENEFRESICYLKESLNFFKKINENGRAGEALCYLSSVYAKQKNFNESVDCANQAYEVCSLIDHKRCMADALSYKAETYLYENRLDEAKEFFLQSINIDQKIKRIGQIWIYNNLALNAIRVIKNEDKQKIFTEEYKKWKNKVNLEWRLNSLKKFVLEK